MSSSGRSTTGASNPPNSFGSIFCLILHIDFVRFARLSFSFWTTIGGGFGIGSQAQELLE